MQTAITLLALAGAGGTAIVSLSLARLLIRFADLESQVLQLRHELDVSRRAQSGPPPKRFQRPAPPQNTPVGGAPWR